MNLAEEYTHWYRKTYIKLELVKLAKNKEMAFLPYTDEHNKAIEIGTLKKGIAVRNINGYCLDYLHQNFEAYDFYNRAVKLYCSLATFKDRALPLFSFSPHTREEQQKEFVDKIMAKPLDYIDGYDFAIDIDEKSWDKGKAYAKKIKDIFDHYRLPYSMNPSGGKTGGWHFHIGYEHFKGFFDPVKMIAASYVINADLQETENIPAIDCSLFDIRRILKLSGSLVFGANKQWNVCLPLDDTQFENCRENQFTPTWCLENVKLMNRGAMERKGSPSGIKDFLQEYYFSSPLVKKKKKARK